jgi:hypothetical protein
MKMRVLVSLICGLVALLSSCSKDNDLGNNPFQKSEIKDTTTHNMDLSPYSLVSIHQELFYPTCANSGCHDGNFEPDFRTIESSYYGLVQVKSTKLDTSKRFPFRVLPFKSNESMLLHRLTHDLNGNSGIMPLGLEADSDYPSRKQEFIHRVRSWIDSGAQDMYGNIVQSTNFPPILHGIKVFQNGKEVPRNGIYETVVLNKNLGTEIVVLFSVGDKEKGWDFTNEMALALGQKPDSVFIENSFAIEKTAPVSMIGLFGNNVQYLWRAQFSISGYSSNEVIWMRLFFNDETPYTLPSNQSMFSLKHYAAIRIL